MGLCQNCGSPEVPYNHIRTKYECGTTSFDDRPNTFEYKCSFDQKSFVENNKDVR